MASHAGRGRGREGRGDPLRLLGYLKANDKVAYVLGIMVMVHLSNQYDRYLFSVAKVPFLDYESYDFALIAGPFFTGVNSVSGVLLSFIGDARPVRLLCTACMVWSASTGAVAFSRQFWQVALARIGQGVADAACSPFAASILRDHFGPELIGSAIGVYFTGLYAGYSLALGVGTLVDDILGWHWAYVLAALGGFVLAAVAFATVPEPEPLVRAQRSGSSVGGSRSITRSTRRPSASALDPANGVVGSLQRVTGREERDGSGARVKEVESRDRVKTGEQSPLSSPTSSSPRYDGNSGAGNVINDGVYDGGAIRAAQATPTYRPLSSKPTSPIERRRRSSPLSGRPARDAVMWPPEGRSSLSHTTPPPPPPPQPLLSRPLSQWRDKLPDLSAAWLGSPSLLLVCVAGGVRDAGGFVFGYYLASYFSPLMDRNLALTGHGSDPCSFSFDADFGAEQICNAAFPWCIDGSCSRLTSSPWHNVGMPSSHLEWFVSWIPLVGGSIGAMLGGFLSDRLAQRLGTPGRLWVVVVSNALASPFAVGVLLAPYPWCFLCLFGVEVLGEMWIGVILSVVMALVPRHVRVTSVALYNFIITNISGLSTTLVPLLRSYYNESHVFRFVAEPLAGAATVGVTAAAAAAAIANANHEGSFLPESGLRNEPPSRGLEEILLGIDAMDVGELVEVTVTEAGSHGLQAAMLWMYPGMYLASSVFCLAAALALDRDRRSATSVAVVACNSTATDDIACGTAGPRSEYDYRECGDGNFSKSYVGRSGTEGCESVADESGGGHSNRNSSNGVGNLGNGSPASDAINVPLLNERARPVNGRTSLGAR